MGNSPGYIAFLLAVIGGFMGHVYLTADQVQIAIDGKRVEQTTGRRGLSGERYVVETHRGDYPLLEFPLVGFFPDAKDAYESLIPGQTVEARIGHWPPEWFPTQGHKYIIAIN